MFHLADVNDLYSPTGGGVRTYHENKLAYYRDRSDVRYSLVVPGDRDEVEAQGAVRVVRVKSPRIPGLRHYRMFVDPFRLRRALRRLDPDAVEMGGWHLTPWMTDYARRGSKALAAGFWHTDYPRAMAERYASKLGASSGRLAQRIAWRYAGWTHGSLALTFVASDYAQRGLRAAGIHRTRKHPLGVDHRRFQPGRRSEALRRRVGAGPNKPLLLFPHRLIEEKGLNELLAAWPEIRRRQPAVLVILGNGPRLGHLERWLETATDALHLGYERDPDRMACWIASSDLLFALSPYETFGLSAAEAMACAVPLVGAADGAIADHVRNARCGRTVECKDAAGLVEATLEVLAGREEFGRYGAEFAREIYRWDRCFGGMLSDLRRQVAGESVAFAEPEGDVRAMLDQT